MEEDLLLPEEEDLLLLEEKDLLPYVIQTIFHFQGFRKKLFFWNKKISFFQKNVVFLQKRTSSRNIENEISDVQKDQLR